MFAESTRPPPVPSVPATLCVRFLALHRIRHEEPYDSFMRRMSTPTGTYRRSLACIGQHQHVDSYDRKRAERQRRSALQDKWPLAKCCLLVVHVTILSVEVFMRQFMPRNGKWGAKMGEGLVDQKEI